MCNGVCRYFVRGKINRYCQKCARYIPDSRVFQENKKLQRRRCECCGGLLRNKIKSYKASSAQAIKNMARSS